MMEFLIVLSLVICVASFVLAFLANMFAE